MLEFDFMKRTLMVGFMLSIMIPMIGVVMVNRKTSMVGDALAHNSLAGVGLGLIMGINPLVGAVLVCIVSALLIEKVRKKFPHYGDMATAMIMSLGLGIAAILSDFAPGGNNFEAYLFGSISTVDEKDVWNVFIIFILVVGASVINYASLLDIAIDKKLARVSGVKVEAVNTIFTILSAVTIALAVKVVGALLVMSLIVLPVATTLLVARSYKSTYILAIILGIIYMMLGITISYYLEVKPGGAIVLCAISGMVIMFLYHKLRKVKNKNKKTII